MGYPARNTSVAALISMLCDLKNYARQEGDTTYYYYKPVIALPTSVGYGANFHGLSALLTMLNSCAEGIAVVNIDNTFMSSPGLFFPPISTKRYLYIY